MTRRVDYDRVAAGYDSRYARNTYSGVEQALASFVEDSSPSRLRVFEIGCGTGHWVRKLRASERTNRRLKSRLDQILSEH